MRKITIKTVERFEKMLVTQERSPLTIKKYIRDIKAFVRFAENHEISKKTVLEYKKHLLEIHTVSSVNSILAALNGFFEFIGWADLKTKSIKLQRKIFCPEAKELTRAEYTRLCRAAENRGNDSDSTV